MEAFDTLHFLIHFNLFARHLIQIKAWPCPKLYIVSINANSCPCRPKPPEFGHDDRMLDHLASRHSANRAGRSPPGTCRTTLSRPGRPSVQRACCTIHLLSPHSLAPGLNAFARPYPPRWSAVGCWRRSRRLRHTFPRLHRQLSSRRQWPCGCRSIGLGHPMHRLCPVTTRRHRLSERLNHPRPFCSWAASAGYC